MQTIEIHLSNAEQITATLDNAAAGISNLTPLMRALAGTMYYAVMLNFDAGGRPAWLGLRYRVGVPLNDTGHLRGSINQAFDQDSARVGTNCIYAAIHNFGGVIRPKKARWLYIPLAGGGGRRVKSVTIPQREFLTLTPQDEADLLDDVQTYFRQILPST